MTEEKYEGLLPRFLKYVKTETRSNPCLLYTSPSPRDD